MKDENDIKNHPLFDEVLHRFVGHYEGAEYIEMPDFGVYCLSLTKAAELVTIDMWTSGMYEHEEPENFDGNYHCSTVKHLLAKEIHELTKKLTISATQGKLKLEYECVDFDSDEIIPERSFVHHSELEKWLRKREYVFNDFMADWFNDDHMELVEAIIEEVRFFNLDPALYKKVRNQTTPNIFIDPEDGVTNLLSAKETIRELATYNKALLTTINNHKKEKAEKPISTSQRRTLLTIIAALCDYSEIDPQARGAGQRIAEMTQKIGAPITAETIKKYLDEMPDATESRMK